MVPLLWETLFVLRSFKIWECSREGGPWSSLSSPYNVQSELNVLRIILVIALLLIGKKSKEQPPPHAILDVCCVCALWECMIYLDVGQKNTHQGEVTCACGEKKGEKGERLWRSDGKCCFEQVCTIALQTKQGQKHNRKLWHVLGLCVCVCGNYRFGEQALVVPQRIFFISGYNSRCTRC